MLKKKSRILECAATHEDKSNIVSPPVTSGTAEQPWCSSLPASGYSKQDSCTLWYVLRRMWVTLLNISGLVLPFIYSRNRKKETLFK